MSAGPARRLKIWTRLRPTLHETIPFEPVHFRVPAMGRPGRVPGTRELVVHENYVVPYRVKDDVVQIIRIQHVARLWPERF